MFTTWTSGGPALKTFASLYSAPALAGIPGIDKSSKIAKFMADIRDNFKVEHLALSQRGAGLYLCTPAWQSIHEADRFLLDILRETTLRNETAIISDTPVFLTHTSLVDDLQSIGRLPYRSVLLQLSDSFSLGLLSNPSLDINQLY